MKMLILIVVVLVPAFAFAQDKAILYIRAQSLCEKVLKEKPPGSWCVRVQCFTALECDQVCGSESEYGGYSGTNEEKYKKYTECRGTCFPSGWLDKCR